MEFDVKSKDDKTVVVTDFGHDALDGKIKYDLYIPSTVTYNDVTYSVVGIYRRGYHFEYETYNSITIENGVDNIGYDDGLFAFYRVSFTDINLPPSLKNIADGAFYRYYNYSEHINVVGKKLGGEVSVMYSSTPLIISNYVKIIPSKAFYYYSLGNVTLGRRVKEIGDNSFTEIYNLYCCALTPPKLHVYSIGKEKTLDISLTYVMVPPGCKKAYQKDAFWGRAASIEEYGYNVDVEFSEGKLGYSDINSTFSLTPEITWLNEDSKERYRDWTSSDETVATVDKDGVVTTHKYGKTTITFTIEDERGIPFDCEYNLTVADLASVTDILEADDTDTAIEVFTLNGLKVSDTTDNLPAGLYIVKSAKEAKKICIK